MTACEHPEDRLRPTILNADNPDYAYCLGCSCVVKRVDGMWVPDSVPGQITKSSYSYGPKRRTRGSHR